MPEGPTTTATAGSSSSAMDVAAAVAAAQAVVAATVPDAAVAAVADAVQMAVTQQEQPVRPRLPPPPLPIGWVMKESRAQPNYYYYYHQETGTSTWQPPVLPKEEQEEEEEEEEENETNYNASQTRAVASPSANRSDPNHSRMDSPNLEESSSNKKRPGEDTTSSPTPTKKLNTGSSSRPLKVRVLHILKKHKDSRRPSSWRQKVITMDKEKATEELKDLMGILEEEAALNDAESLQATFEELARTESDCSSAKRGGDLGFFGPRKMQPAFEEASFALDIGQLSGVVETSSGVHVLLRIG